MTKARFDALRQAGAEYVKKVDTLPKLLAEKGYRCLQTGKHWEGHWRNAGFTEGMTLAEPSGGANGDKQLPNGELVAHGNGDAGLDIGREGMQPIIEFLDEVGDEQPFFIWYAPFLTHTPHDYAARTRTLWQQYAHILTANNYLHYKATQCLLFACIIAWITTSPMLLMDTFGFTAVQYAWAQVVVFF